MLNDMALITLDTTDAGFISVDIRKLVNGSPLEGNDGCSTYPMKPLES